MSRAVDALNFAEAMEELDGIVKRLEDGRVPLEEAICIFERGQALKGHCGDKLKQAMLKVESIDTAHTGDIDQPKAG